MSKFKPGNDAAAKHGGAGAVRALRQGTPFGAVAREVEKNIEIEFETIGPVELMKREAIRAQTAAECYWQAFIGAVESGDMAKIQSYIKVWGYLSASTVRTLEKLILLQAKDRQLDPSSVLDVYREKRSNNAPNS